MRHDARRLGTYSIPRFSPTIQESFFAGDLHWPQAPCAWFLRDTRQSGVSSLAIHLSRLCACVPECDAGSMMGQTV